MAASAGLGRWPAVLHPDAAERCYYGERERSRRWVDGLATRGGVPRWYRIMRCGDPVALFRVSDQAVSWEHRWCRDRACYACARSRSRKLGEQLRLAVPARDPTALHFVTLTRPKVRGESARDAWRRFMRAWATLRHSPAWRGVVGGVRAIEVTWSDGHERARNRFGGWHVHAHLILEVASPRRGPCDVCCGTGWKPRARGLRCTTCSSATVLGDGTLNAACASVLGEWTAIVQGNLRAQCAVALSIANVGQLAKYLTKLWELNDDRARALFDAAAGKRIVEGFGAWRRWKRWADVERTPHGWVASGIPLREIESLRGGAPVPFESRYPATAIEPGAPDDTRRWLPRVTVASVPARMLLAKLAADPRPVWERVGETPPDHAERVAAAHRQLAVLARERYLPMPARLAGCGPPEPFSGWEH